MIRRFIIAVTTAAVLALPCAAWAQEQALVPVHSAEIAELRAGLSEGPGASPARARLSRAFIDADITFSRRHLDSWSTQLEDRWAQHGLFFDTQLSALANWEQALAAGLVDRDTAEAALAPAMTRIRVLAAAMPSWQEDDVLRLAERAFWTDMAHEIGCCDALYYHALAEADAVWSAAQSPDPAAIAALEIIPMVPTERVTAIDPGARAYDWLATRAETLAATGDIAPAARRALLAEASLLEDLFGPPANQPPDRSLAGLAARESFAARPVAPLFRMAAMTQSRHLRNALLVEALDRLEDRADHLQSGSPEAEAETDSAAQRALGGESPAQGSLPTVPPADAADAADRIDAILAGLRDPQLDLAGLIELADMAEATDSVFDGPDALEILQDLSDTQ